jgi:hypothetical protein
MHFRIFDLAAERSVWSIPTIDSVPSKLRNERLVVRSIDNDGGVLDVVPVEGEKLEDIVTQLLADRRAARLSIHLAANDAYAGHALRFDAGY